MAARTRTPNGRPAVKAGATRSRRGVQSAALAQGRDLRWWREESEPHATVEQVLNTIRSQQRGRDAHTVHCAAMYGDLPVEGWTLGPGQNDIAESPVYDRLALNVCANVCDTLQAEVVQGRPRAMFLTNGADWTVQQQAQRMSKFVDGVFYECGIDETASQVALDALIFGTGVCKILERDGRVCVERVLPGGIYVDRVDGRTGKPRSLYQVHYMDRSVLAELYPDHAEHIEDCAPPSGDWALGSNTVSDQVLVTEAWHLKSGKNATDGRHVVTISNATLHDEEWADPSFPFAFLRWKVPPTGFWGTGIIDQITGLQIEINRLCEDIRNAQALMGLYKIFVQRGSNVIKSALDNEAGTIIEHDGPPPVFATFQSVHPEVYQQLERWYRAAFEILGVSQLAAQSQKPAGLDSGRALRVFIDNQSKRFVRFSRAYEEWHVEVARQTIRLMGRLAANDNSYEVVYHSRNKVERIEWSAVKLEESAYVLKCFPISALPNTPAGRLAALQELFTAKILDRDAFMRLADFPDFDAERELLTAPRELIEESCQRMVCDGEYFPPESFMNLPLAMYIGGLHYQRARLQGVPEERLELLRRFIEEAEALVPTPPQPPPQQLPMSPAGPMGPGGEQQMAALCPTPPPPPPLPSLPSPPAPSSRSRAPLAAPRTPSA